MAWDWWRCSLLSPINSQWDSAGPGVPDVVGAFHITLARTAVAATHDLVMIPEETFVYRPLGARLGIAFASFVLVAGQGVLALLVWRGFGGDGLAVAILALAIWVAVRGMAMRFAVSNRGVEIVNHWRSRFFAWDEIEDVRLGATLMGGFVIMRVVVISLVSGRRFPVKITAGRGNRDEMLNRLRAAATSRGIRIQIRAEDLSINDGLLTQYRDRHRKREDHHRI